MIAKRLSPLNKSDWQRLEEGRGTLMGREKGAGGRGKGEGEREREKGKGEGEGRRDSVGSQERG